MENNRRKKKEEENAPLCRSCAPELISTKPNSPLIDLLVPAQEEKEKNKRKEKEKDHETEYYPPSSIYVASYEEGA